MFITKKALPRRTVLRGLGASLALQMLDAMTPAMAATAKPIQRLGFVFMPMGADLTRWVPKGKTLDELPPILKSLEPIRNKVNALSNLELRHHLPACPRD